MGALMIENFYDMAYSGALVLLEAQKKSQKIAKNSPKMHKKW
jgi:hypothetical protein